MKIFDFLKKRHDLKISITERERKNASIQRLNLINQYEKAMRNQAEVYQKDFDKELKKRLEEKNEEIRILKKLIANLKHSFENLHSLSGELAVEFRTVAIIAGKTQNRFVNIQDRALREAETIDLKINKVIDMET